MTALEYLEAIERLIRENDLRRLAHVEACGKIDALNEQLAGAKRTTEQFRQRFRKAERMIAQARKHLRADRTDIYTAFNSIDAAYAALDLRRAR